MVQQLMTEFCAEKGLSSWRDPDKFEVFATHCVLSDHTFDSFEAVDYRIGGSEDGGIDGYAVVINENLFNAPDDVERCLLATTDISPTIVVVQAKTSASMSRATIADLRVRVEYILRTEEPLDHAADVEPLRECLRRIKKHRDRLNSRGVRLEIAYASTSLGANDELRREASRAAQALAHNGIIGEVRFEFLGRTELSRRYERAQWSSKAKLTFTGHYALPVDPGITQARQGLVPAAELVQAIADASGDPKPNLFSENIREYQPAAPVNDEIRETLRDEATRRRFAVLNNGITIVARSLRAWQDSQVVIRDFQVVNGCQTCYVLAEESDRLDGVAVKVQIIECDDDEVINEIVTATNRQTEIPKVYFTNRNQLMRRLEVHYRHQYDENRPLYFARRPGKGANDLRRGVIGMNPQLRAHVAMFGRPAPSSGHRDLDTAFDEHFGNASEREFYTAGAALYRWDWLADTRRIHKRYRSLGYQAIAVLGVLYGVRPLVGDHKAKGKRLDPVDEVLWSDGGWELLALDIQSVLDKALTQSSSPDPKTAAASITFGKTVVALARQQPRRLPRPARATHTGGTLDAMTSRAEPSATIDHDDSAAVAAFRERIGIESIIDVHTHFMPRRVLAKVWAYFDLAGPVMGRAWPITYRHEEERLLRLLRGFGVRAFTSMLYPHKPGMARWLNDWAADFAARTPDCLHTATFFDEPGAIDDVTRAVDQGARVFKCHLQVGGFDPNSPLLDKVWGLLADAGIPVVTHCGSGPIPGAHTGPEPMAALLERHPRLPLVVAHLGMPEYEDFLGLAERYERVMLDTTMAFTRFTEAMLPFPDRALPRLGDLGDRVLLGTDFPNIPYSYAHALAALECTGLGEEWLRAVCHDNAARLFGL
nr:AIPR family protein [Stackebrandtia nassauensis]